MATRTELAAGLRQVAAICAEFNVGCNTINVDELRDVVAWLNEVERGWRDKLPEDAARLCDLVVLLAQYDRPKFLVPACRAEELLGYARYLLDVADWVEGKSSDAIKFSVIGMADRAMGRLMTGARS